MILQDLKVAVGYSSSSIDSECGDVLVRGNVVDVGWTTVAGGVASSRDPFAVFHRAKSTVVRLIFAV